MEKTIGGQRLGGGNKNNVQLHNYNRSTHNLKESFKTAMAAGTLVPFYCVPGLPGDTFTIDLNAMARTIPTNGPLFGSFKLQMDMFQIPMRLYNGIMHNNPINIGMNMANVKFPKIALKTKAWTPKDNFSKDAFKKNETATNSLLRYLGISGMGVEGTNQIGDNFFYRKFNAIPVLGYYDIFKCYYSNKMEEAAYVLTGNPTPHLSNISEVYTMTKAGATHKKFGYDENTNTYIARQNIAPGTIISIKGEDLQRSKIYIDQDTIATMVANNQAVIRYDKGDLLSIKYTGTKILDQNTPIYAADTAGFADEVKLQKFPLENIDKMREDILKHMSQSEFVIREHGDGDYLPYNILTTTYDSEQGEFSHVSRNISSQNGLCVKTYQSDLFNNWVRTDWIDGANGIAEVTAIKTDSNKFYLDTFNLMTKIYNQLNRVAVSGGTLEDWSEVTWGEEAIRRAETPIYMGGMSSEIVFEEVISTADTNEDAKLGTLAGKGTLAGRKGGHIEIKPKEPVFIMGIVSITPRLDYTQGNAWFMTELDSMDDLHKPALDGIGFQELITEQMAWWTTSVDNTQSGERLYRKSAGKVPAWINYMTAIDKAYSHFADQDKQGFMILSRDYEFVHSENLDTGADIADLTTYIDPSKYNYAFAYTGLDSQNFWIQIVSDVVARRKMSAKIIPNL